MHDLLLDLLQLRLDGASWPISGCGCTLWWWGLMPWKTKLQAIQPWPTGRRVLLILLGAWKSLGEVLNVVGLTECKPEWSELYHPHIVVRLGRLSIGLHSCSCGLCSSCNLPRRALTGLLSVVLGMAAVHHGPSTCRTHLLPFKPAFQASKMQNVSARQLLRSRPLIEYWSGSWSRLGRLNRSVCARHSIRGRSGGLSWIRHRPRPHLLSANNASVFPLNLLYCSVGISLVHIMCRCSVS